MLFKPTDLVALYARLSMDRAGEAENVEIQLEEGEEFVDDEGGCVTLRFKDNDISASNFSKKPRPEYDLLIQAVERGKVEVIVVTEMTRLYRRLEELLELIKMAKVTPLKGIWTTDGIGYDLSTPEGIHAAIAAVNNAMLESAKISKRTKRKQKARAKKGKHHGGVRSYCYEPPIKDKHGNLLNKETCNTALVDDEVKVFLSNVDRMLNGDRAMWIVYNLNERGIPAAAGGKWTVGNFQRLMTKKRYVIFDDDDPKKRGICEYNGEEYRAEWQGIISRTTHAQLVAAFNKNAQPWAHGEQTGRGYLLTGLIECGLCGTGCMGGGRFTAPEVFQRRYGCRKIANTGQTRGCGKIYRGADPVDALVTEAVWLRLDSPEVARALTATTDTEESIDELVAQLTEKQRHRRQLVAEYGQGEHKKDDYKIMLAAADDAIERLTEQLAGLHNPQTSVALAGSEVVRELWDNATLAWKRNIIELVVEKVVLHPSHPVRRNWRQWRFEPADVEIVFRR